MDLVNEYLRAVAALLPKAQRDDIIAELRDTILSQIEEREADLGRPLTDDEVEALLREVGHPVVIAARYSDGPQHVVGPTLYPYWLFAVKAAILLQVAIAVVVVVVRTLAFGNFSLVFGQAIGSGVTGALVLIGAATCAAWFIERRGARIDYLDKWRVRDLRYLEIVAWDFAAWRDWFTRHTRDAKHRPRRAYGPTEPGAAPSRQASPMAPMAPAPPMPPWHPAMTPMGRGLGYIVLGTLLVLWWTGVLPLNLGLDAMDWAALDLDPGSLGKVDWMVLRHLLFWPVLGYATVFLLQGAFMLAYPFAVRLHGLLETAKGSALLAFCVWIWTASPLASAVGMMSRPEFAQRMAMLRQSPPLPLEPIATIVVISVGFTACGLILRGLWNLAFGGPASYRDLPPPHGYSSSAM
jgi:hypothetical protein